jgi:hypothetical protein
MAPHCDTMDGPVVTAAELALEMENVNYVLPFVKKKYEKELKDAFDRTIIVRELSGDAAEVADYWFFETAVRLHKLGEGKPFTGIKHSGLDWGFVVPKAEEAIQTGDITELEDFLMDFVQESIEKRFQDAISLKEYDLNDVEAARNYVNAMLEFIMFSHHLYKFVEERSQ